MAFTIPSLSDLVSRARNAFRSELPGSDAWLWPNNLAVISKVLGGLMWELFGRLDQVQKQKFALTAEGEWLDLHASEIGLARRPSALATGSVTFTSSGNLTVALGAVVQRADGVQFVITAAGSRLGAGLLTLPATAVVAGAGGTTVEGAPLSIVSGVVGSATTAVADGGLPGGADVEDDETLRTRILFRKRNPFQGGAPADYVVWASAIPGVTRVFVERRWGGPGTVRVFPLTDGATIDGIPSLDMIAMVQADLEARAPAGTVVNVAAPTPVTIDVTVSGLEPSTVAVREAILAELRVAFVRLGRVTGSDTPHPAMPFLAVPGSFSRSWVWQAIANATGEERHVLVAPAGDVALAAGSLPVLGTVTFV